MSPAGLEPLIPARTSLVDWYLRNRRRSRDIFDLIETAAYYSRPISLRNPIVFYEGHLPAFSLIAFIKRGLGRPGVDERLEELFARGIDPETEASAVPRSGRATVWPSRDDVLAFGRAADALIVSALRDAALDGSRPAMRRAEGIYTALEHELMHQETLLYMWHRLPHGHKARPSDLTYERGSEIPPAPARVRIPEGVATLGADRAALPFGWDNEFQEHRVAVPAFDMDVFNVTNAAFMAFVEDGGYARRELWSEDGWTWRAQEQVEHPLFWRPGAGGWLWHGMFEDVPLPPAWPVYVSWAEAAAFAEWCGRRLPTEAEYHRAAFGVPDGSERRYPWGDEAPDASRGNFDFRSWEPVPVGARPAGASAWGVHDLVGNGWEWTSTVFGPFPGFEPMASYPEYSADFFDGQHYVMKGASPATAKELVRRSFRNWFRPNYPYVYATFRTVSR
ncbi:MAG TPA: SUMF1/EgtB/PvdO family nonheme iron enzyme [Vicinamibacterales bacterium]|nr:SUMF1/EgtB/PvdO family nonheme iron enzyme [Vicinamibacterales bacterium]